MLHVFRFFLFFLLFFNASVYAKEIRVIRDAETENFFKIVSSPILKNAGISEDSVNFFVDHQNYVNAFVTSDYNIFITTEMIVNMTSVNQLAAVIAHEIGHISGGHFNKQKTAMKDSVFISVLSSILAIGAYASGSSDAGNAILMGGASLGRYNAMSFSRKQENFADQAALRFLEKSNYDLMGLYDLLTIIQKRERLKKINPYNMTHPLSNDRKQIVLNRIGGRENENKKDVKLEKKFKLIQAKLIGYLSTPDFYAMYFPETESVESLYGKVYQYLKLGNFEKAIKTIDKCISIDPKNEYFYELKGQILYENGKFFESIRNFRIAKKIKNDETYFDLLLAKALFQTRKKDNVEESIMLLEQYVKKESFPVEALHFLALNYAQQKKFLSSSITLSEKFLLLKDSKSAKLHLKNAQKILKKTPQQKNLINDLKVQIDKLEKDEKNFNN